MTDVKNIAYWLNYPDAEQVMAIKGMLPIKIYNTCLNINVLNDLKDFLIKGLKPKNKEQVCCC